MKNLRVYIFSAALAAFAANAALLNSDPEYALILGRQAPGTPQYECHSDCGTCNLLSPFNIIWYF